MVEPHALQGQGQGYMHGQGHGQQAHGYMHGQGHGQQAHGQAHEFEHERHGQGQGQGQQGRGRADAGPRGEGRRADSGPRAEGRRPVEIDADLRARRLYDRLRARLRPALPGAASDVRDILLLMPDLLLLICRLIADPRVAPGNRALAVLGVTYLLSPIDLLPSFLFGPLGVLDDLVVLAATVSRLVNHVHPDIVRSHWSGQQDVLLAVERVSRWSEQQIGRRLRSLFRLS